MNILKNIYASKDNQENSQKKTEGCSSNESNSLQQVNLPRKWSKLSYAGENRNPQSLDPSAGSWSLYYMKKDEYGNFTTLDGHPITFAIQHPENFNFDNELVVVKYVQKNLTQHQRTIAEYWGDGPATKQWTPIIDRLIDAYGFSPVRAARVLAAVQAGINDAFVVTWYYKYLWDIPRPNQLDQKLATAICTPKFPTYPSGHSVISGTAEVILGYFFPPEADRLRELADENSISRLYGGVHFPADLTEGLRLGRQIGELVVDVLRRQGNANQSMIDIPVTESKTADLPPPPYEQVIPYPPRHSQCDQPLIP